MVRMERNAGEVDDFIRFWSAVPGVDQVRVKATRPICWQPEAGHTAQDGNILPLSVARPHVREALGRCVSMLPELHAGWPAGGNIGTQPLTEIWNSDEMQRMRRLHVGGAPMRSTSARLLHHHPASIAGSGQSDPARSDGA